MGGAIRYKATIANY